MDKKDKIILILSILIAVSIIFGFVLPEYKQFVIDEMGDSQFKTGSIWYNIDGTEANQYVCVLPPVCQGVLS